jgi:hypothetical protein
VTDRIPSDHDTVDSRRVHLETVGRTRRLQLSLPSELECTHGDVIFLSLEGDGNHSQVTTGLDGDRTIQGAFPTRQLAQTNDAENALQQWMDDSGLAAGDALVIDVLRAGYAYGLRRPGERVVYSPPEPPDSSLADIASDIEK